MTTGIANKLRAGAGYAGRSGRQCHTKHRGEIDFSRDWADLPLQRRRDIGKTGISRTVDTCKVCWRVDEKFETVCNACAQARICAVQKSIAVSRADIDAVLDLQTAGRHNNAGVRDVRSIGGNPVPDAWTTVCLRGDCAVIDKQHRQDDCELPNAYGPASERECGPYAIRNRLLLLHTISRSLTQIARWQPDWGAP
jgi:hypothetical protein